MVDTTPFNGDLAQKIGSFEQLLEKVLLGAVTKELDLKANLVEPAEGAVETPTNP